MIFLSNFDCILFYFFRELPTPTTRDFTKRPSSSLCDIYRMNNIVIFKRFGGGICRPRAVAQEK